MGPIEVPADRYWGAQTQRSLHHFAIGERPHADRGDPRHRRSSRRPPRQVNQRARQAPAPTRPTLIVQAADEVIAGKLDDAVPAAASGRPAAARRPT